MACAHDNDFVLNDLVSLPMVFLDSNSKAKGQEGRQNPAELVSTVTETAFECLEKLNLPSIVGDVWSRVTAEIKANFRDACFEVLQKTAEYDEEASYSAFDEDARLLD